MINPKKIYSRYFMATCRPDSTTMIATLNRLDFKTFLDSIQPKSPQYLALQKAYRDSRPSKAFPTRRANAIYWLAWSGCVGEINRSNPNT
ncbi:hypothetical protein ACFJIV_12245 [Mucilaginibacter sp. UC70_90]